MIDWDAAPEFGDRATDPSATIRPSAYGIISDGSGRLVVVRTPLGVFLPGGGSDEAETPEATVARETREECGYAVRVGTWRRTAVERVSSAREQTRFEKRCTFCDGTFVDRTGAPTEADHAPAWMPADQAAARLTPASHRWAVGEWLASGGDAPKP